MQIHHIGYLVKNIEKSKEKFLQLGFIIKEEIVNDKLQGIDICFLEKDSVVIELVSPNRDDSVVSNLIKVYRNSPYHICYSSDNFGQDIKELEKNGYTAIRDSHSAIAIGGKKILFLMSPYIGMIEVVEE